MHYAKTNATISRAHFIKAHTNKLYKKRFWTYQSKTWKNMAGFWPSKRSWWVSANRKIKSITKRSVCFNWKTFVAKMEENWIKWRVTCKELRSPKKWQRMPWRADRTTWCFPRLNSLNRVVITLIMILLGLKMLYWPKMGLLMRARRPISDFSLKLAWIKIFLISVEARWAHFKRIVSGLAKKTRRKKNLKSWIRVKEIQWLNQS